MGTIQDLMLELDGADEATVRRIASESGSLPVRLAMLRPRGAPQETQAALVRLSAGRVHLLKGEPMKELVLALAAQLWALGYRAFLDVENLDRDADFQIPSIA